MGRRRSYKKQKTLCAFRKNLSLSRRRTLREKNKENVAPNKILCSKDVIQLKSLTDCSKPLVELETDIAMVPSMESPDVFQLEPQPGCSKSLEDPLPFMQDHNYSMNTSASDISRPVSPKLDISGRRIFNVQHLFDQILNDERHLPFDCGISNMVLLQETRIGFSSTFWLKCKMCNVIKKITSEKDDQSNININAAVTLGAISTGIGYAQVEELCAAVNMPCMSNKTYLNHHKNVGDVILTTAWEQMAKAAREEAEYARSIGNVDEDGIPFITVVTDGAWAKRSYSLNYNSSSGVACIIGLHTRKLLFLGIRNKYCSVCERQHDKNRNVEHICYKNWNESSTAMESDIIVEGFRTSVQIHGLKYLKMIGDGDSSVFKKLLEMKPYGNKLVVKIECKNHLLRNFSKKLREITTHKRSQSKNMPVHPSLRKIILGKLLRFRTAIVKAADYRNKQSNALMENVRLLQNDLKNIPSHIFGEHSGCKNIGYFKCEPSSDEKNLMPLMRECGIDQDLQIPLQRLIDNAGSLILNMNNNIAEQFNSVVCKFVGGKRVNYTLRGSYKTRCEAAALSFNSKGNYYGEMHRALVRSSPKSFTKKYMDRKKKIPIKKVKKHIRRQCRKNNIPDKDYGPDANIQILALDDQLYKNKKEEFLKSIEKSEEQINRIALDTVGQSANPLWIQERSIRLTASNFGRICKRRKALSTANLVKNLLYSNFMGNKATRYGNKSEPIAINELKEKLNIDIKKSGFYIHPREHYLGASPDGLIGEDGIIEIKCPSSISTMSPMEAILQNKIKFARVVDGHLKLKRNHNYFYQIQGQLAVTNRQWCIFCIWSPFGLLTEKIYRDDNFWRKALPDLTHFYFNCMLPELVDPQHIKGLPIRNLK